MVTSTNRVWRWALVLAAAGIVLGVMLSPTGVSLADKKIQVAPPPPPPPTPAKPSPAFDYKHEIKKVVRDRKPVIALLRPGDTAQMADALPFGRGITVTDAKAFWVVDPGRQDEPVYMPVSVRQFLMRELLETREFVVVERERIMEILRELAFTKTQAVNPDTAPRPGRLIGVHYIVEGSFFAAGGLPPNDVALDGVKREIAKRQLAIDPRQACVMYLTVYKVETGEVKAMAIGADLQPLVAVKKAVEDLVDQLGEIVEPIKISQVNPQTGQALLDIGTEGGAKPGDLFTLGPAGGAATAGQTGPARTGATAPPPEPAKPAPQAKVVQSWPLYSLVEVPAEDRAQVKDGQEARPAAAAAPGQEEKPPAAPAATEKSGSQ